MAQILSAADILATFPDADGIGDEVLRAKVIGIWQEMAAEMPWHDIREVPQSARGDSGRTLVSHVRGVTRTALAICETAKEVQDKPFDRDLLLAACLLHDVSKLVETEPQPGAARGGHPSPAQYSELGRSLQHAAYTVHKALAAGLPMALAHIILTHTHESRRRGRTWEAAALFYADNADIDAGLSAVGKPLFLQRFRLDQ